GWANGLGAMRACGGESGNHEGMPLRRICLAFRFAAETTQNKKDNKRRNEREQPNGDDTEKLRFHLPGRIGDETTLHKNAAHALPCHAEMPSDACLVPAHTVRPVGKNR